MISSVMPIANSASSVESFDVKLRHGRLGEGLIARWLNSQGWNVVPAYDVEIGTGKGPRLFMADGRQLITPDLLVFRGHKFLWVEAKTKSAFTWYRKTETWQTGIDRRHWHEYLRVQKDTEIDIYLLFLQLDGIAKDTPLGLASPTGLYGEAILNLRDCIDHESDNYGSTGMVYWCRQSLKKWANIEEFIS